MSILFAFLILVEAVTSFLLIGIIFLQKTKGGMGGAFGGGMGEAIFGSRMGNVLTKGTAILGVVFLVNTTLLAYLTANRRTTSVTDGMSIAAPAMPSPSAPLGVPSDVEPFQPGAAEFPEPVGAPTGPVEPVDLTQPALPTAPAEPSAGDTPIVSPVPATPAETQSVEAEAAPAPVE